MTQSAPIPVMIPPNKFIPPHIDSSQSLIRNHLTTAGLPSIKSTKKAIVIEAQAGQGKSTLAAQFLEINALNFIWHRFGPEDSDPHFALSSFLQNLKSSIPAFNPQQLNSFLHEGQGQSLEIRRCASIILSEIARSFIDEFYIVFDDLHLIEDDSPINTLIEYLLDDSPRNLRFLLLSRQPLRIRAKILRNSLSVCYLTTNDLALTALEIESLFCNILQQPVCRQEALDIHEITGGWIMGIILAMHPVAGKGKFWRTTAKSGPLTSSGRDHLLDYLQEEIYSQIPEEFHIALQRIAVFDIIPVDLAQIITGVEDIGAVLRYCCINNLLIYQVDEHQQIFRFHQFFRDFLRIRATRQFSSKEMDEIHTHAAEYYLDRKMVDKAMLYYRKAGDFQKLEEILKENGLALAAINRTSAIHALLRSIPEETLFQFGWLTLFSGLLQIDYTPRDTLRFFESARTHFVESNDEAGELLSLALAVYYHSVIAGCCDRGAALLPRMEDLLLRDENVLPVHVRTMAAGNLALGLLLFNAEVEKSRKFSAMASRIADKHSLHHFAATSRFVQGYIELLSGNIPKFRKEAEFCYQLLNSSDVNWSAKLTIRMLYLCYLSMTGDHLNFAAEKQEINTASGQRVLSETVIAPYLYVWESSNLFSIGKTDKAMELLHRGLESTLSATSAHMHSQLLQWQAFGHAILGDKKEALSCIRQSIQLMSETGGPFHDALNAIIAGAVYSRLEMSEFADYSFTKGVEIAEAFPSSFLQICAYMNRSFHKLVTAGPAAALSDLRMGLGLMKRHSFNHFWTWEPAMMIRLLSLAVQHNIETSYATQLAAERLDVTFTDTGDMIPVLHFTLLDNFQICKGRQILFRASNFTPSQREILGFLLTSKGQQLRQEQLQLELWPNKPPENARRSFDTLLNRLRKEISHKITESVKQYISLQKGILELEYSQIDAVEFSKMATAGLQLSRNGQWWQAGYAFRTALSYWKGLWPEESFCNEMTTALTDQLAGSLLEITLAWAEDLAERGRPKEAIALLEQTLQSHFQDERPVRLLYSLYIATHNYLKAGKTLDRYKSALEKLDYSAAEVEELLAADPIFACKRSS